jgi:hypothetical protein
MSDPEVSVCYPKQKVRCDGQLVQNCTGKKYPYELELCNQKRNTTYSDKCYLDKYMEDLKEEYSKIPESLKILHLPSRKDYNQVRPSNGRSDKDWTTLESYAKWHYRYSDDGGRAGKTIKCDEPEVSVCYPKQKVSCDGQLVQNCTGKKYPYEIELCNKKKYTTYSDKCYLDKYMEDLKEEYSKIPESLKILHLPSRKDYNQVIPSNGRSDKDWTTLESYAKWHYKYSDNGGRAGRTIKCDEPEVSVCYPKQKVRCDGQLKQQCTGKKYPYEIELCNKKENITYSDKCYLDKYMEDLKEEYSKIPESLKILHLPSRKDYNQVIPSNGRSDKDWTTLESYAKWHYKYSDDGGRAGRTKECELPTIQEGTSGFNSSDIDISDENGNADRNADGKSDKINPLWIIIIIILAIAIIGVVVYKYKIKKPTL